MIMQNYKESFATMEAAQKKLEELENTEGVQVIGTSFGNLTPGIIDLDIDYWLMEEEDGQYDDPANNEG